MKPFNRQAPSSLPWNRTSGSQGFRQGDGHRTDPTSDEGLRELYWVPVSSSNVDAISWSDQADYGLFVRFRDGAVYQYQASESQYDDMFGASSPGRYVHYVLSQLPYRRVY